MHQKVHPSILYFGTPVILVSTVNPDGSTNLAPFSSVFWLGWRCVVGINAASQTARNIRSQKEAVINLPSAKEVHLVNSLAKTTGADPVPKSKLEKGYTYLKDKLTQGGFQTQESETVKAKRISNCPVQLEARLANAYDLAAEDERQKGAIQLFEFKITRVYVQEELLTAPNSNKINPDVWKPLIMSFQEFYTLGTKLQHSTLAEIPEHLYNSLDRKEILETMTS